MRRVSVRNRVSWRALVTTCLLLAAHSSGPVWCAQAPVDLPGAEVVRPSHEPALLEPLLPRFEALAMELPTDAEGMGPLRLSPGGRYCLAELRTSRGQAVLLFDADGKLIRDLTSDKYSHASGAWGASDQQVLLECRTAPGTRPTHLRVNPTTGATAAGSMPGLPGWAPGGKDYLVGLAVDSPGVEREPAWFQRYTSTNDPVGRPLAIAEPVWSGDGLWLAFAAQAKATETAPPEVLSMNEVRVLPARGDVPRVVLSRGGWSRLAKTNGWLRSAGPEQLAWSPGGDALFGVFAVLTDTGDQKCLVRMDIRSPRRDVLLLPADSELVSASADARHWIVRLGDRLFRLDFEHQPVPAPKPIAPTRKPATAN